MGPIDCTVAFQRRRAHRAPPLHLAIVVGIAAAVALVAARPVPIDMSIAIGAETLRPGADLGPVDYLPARLPPPRGPAATWIDTF